MFEKVIDVKNLRKQFGAHEVVKGVSFEASRGEILGLLGANGAGKTTTLHMILGLTTPTSGSVKIFGKTVDEARSEVLQRVNFASSYVMLPFNLRVWENLVVFAKIYQVPNPKPKIDELLDVFEISHLRNKTSGMLSSGEQTRLNLCKALLNDPELLILDEPTASLDPDLADKVRKALQRDNAERGTTIIASSHNMLDVAELCHRVVFMSSGEIVAEGSSADVMEQYESESLEDVFITIARQSNGKPKELEKVKV
jgi:ABC-type multidrug transport system, ATPase component